MATFAYKHIGETGSALLSKEDASEGVTGAEIIGTGLWGYGPNLYPNQAVQDLAHTSFSDLQRAHYEAASHPAEFEWEQQDPTADAIKVREYRKAVHDIKRIIKTPNLGEADSIEAEIQAYIIDAKDILLDIASNSGELINVRAMAARLFVGMLQQSDPRFLHLGCERLVHHSSPMIRHGALLGFADIEDRGRVKLFQRDHHPIVRSEAAEILDEMDV